MSVSVEADLYDFIRDSIRHWVGKNFGSQELDDPSWNIDDLSAHLTKKLNKREQTVKSLKPFDLTITMRESITDGERATLMKRVVEKLERVGGSLTKISYSHDTLDNPLKGETKVTRAKIKVDVPSNYHALRGFVRWLERQEEGHDLFLSFILDESRGDNDTTPPWVDINGLTCCSTTPYLTDN